MGVFVLQTDGANILKVAAPLANSDADKYAAEKAKADARFKEAVEYLEEAAKASQNERESNASSSEEAMK